jgi:aspartate kinase
MSELKVVVSKFGGSSMKNAEAIKRSASVASLKKASVVVVSATYGTTNQLIKLAEVSQKGHSESAKEIVNRIKENHIQIADDLAIESPQDLYSDLFSELETLSEGMILLKDAPTKAYDRLVSLGERMSSPLMAFALNQLTSVETQNFDVRTVMRTDDTFSSAVPDLATIKGLCQKHLLAAKYGEVVYVTQGFVGATAEGETTTLGRGGSDYSAALLAEGIGADLLEIWTDVAGIATTDPRICNNTKPIEEITFQEAAELAVFGAKILHPTTLAPVQRMDIPVFVGSSYEPEAKGTWIKSACSEQPLVRALAVKTDQTLLTVTTPKMLDTYGFLTKIFSVFEKHKVSVDAITTSEISVAMTVNQAHISQKGFFEDLQKLGKVQSEEGLALVSLIGNNINHTAGLAQKIFNGISVSNSESINVRMICLGASRHNFCLVVKNEQANEAIVRLHKTFIEENGGLQ